jgi:hypothetical protein
MIGAEGRTFARSTVDGLDDVDELLLVVERPCDFVVVARAQVDHNVLVSVEEHDLPRRADHIVVPTAVLIDRTDMRRHSRLP